MVTTDTAQTITGVKTISNDTLINGLTVGKGGGNIASNTASGAGALGSNTTGINNTASGSSSLSFNTTGNENTANGRTALFSNTTGSNNTAIGVNALASNTTGSNNTAIGQSTLGTNTIFSNTGGFGYNAQITASNQIQLGDSATTTFAYGAVQNRSDLRDKTDIRNTELGLDFINALHPVDFKWDMREDYRPDAPTRPPENATEEEKNKYKLESEKWLNDIKLSNISHDGSKKRNRFHHGLIAQEVKSILDEKGIDFGGFQDHSLKDGDDVLSIGYVELIAPLIKAVQELSAKIEALEAK
jgi:hypothetical protein